MRHRNGRGWLLEVALTIVLFLVVQAYISGLTIGFQPAIGWQRARRRGWRL